MEVIELGETDFVAGTLTDDEGRPFVVVFSSGGGDGMYPTWVGRTAGGEVACFLTDFLILTDNEGDEPHSGDGDGTPAAPPRPADAAQARPPSLTTPALRRPLTPAKPLSPGQPLSRRAQTPARTVSRKSLIDPAVPTDRPDA